jgi:hypothetical protein
LTALESPRQSKIDSGSAAWLVLCECFREAWPSYVVALVVIVCGFQWGLPDYRHIDKSFHADENAAVWAVDQIHPPGLNPHVFNWGTALFYQVYLLKLLASVGGLVSLGDRGVLVLGRTAVLLSALGAITCLYLLGRRLFDNATGRMAATILAVTPGFAINSHYFKTDVPMAFWMLAVFVLGYKLADSRDQRYLLPLGLLAGYDVATKYSAVPVVFSGLVFLAMSGLDLRKPPYWAIYSASVAGGFLLGTPRIFPNPHEFLEALKTVAQLGKSGQPWAVSRPPAWLDYLTGIAQVSMTFPLWLAAAAGLALLVVTRIRQLLPVWAFLAGYVFLLNQDNWRLVRYTVPLLPLAALFTAALWRDLKKRGAAGHAASFLIYPLLAYSFLFTLSYVRVMRLTDPRVRAGDWISGSLPRGAPVPVSTSHYLGAPQVQLWGFEKLDVNTDAEALRNAASPYLVLSEYVTQRYQGALDHYPDTKRFFEYVRENYIEEIRFENPQTLLGIDSKKGVLITHDWIYPNPRITIYRRAGSPER